MSSARPLRWVGVALVLSSLVRCGSHERNPWLGRPPSPPRDGGGGGADSGLQFGAAGDIGSVVFPDGSACAAEVRRAELLPLDLHVLLDRSGSMAGVTSSGATKWDAVTAAIRGFVQEDGSTGLRVGMQYFPLLRPGVPSSCTADADCGPGAPCLLKACLNAPDVVPCSVDADCADGPCVDVGWCELAPPSGAPLYCTPVGITCPDPYGKCVDIPRRPCVNGIDCSSERYRQLDVDVVPVPAGADAILASIYRQAPDGDTPTGPALAGAIQGAKDGLAANPGHTVAVVLATDGLPTTCDPKDITDVAAIARTAAAGTPAVLTFVVGVFASTDTASPGNLDAIAVAGGTDHAFVADPSHDLTVEFRDALDAIRVSSFLSCELSIPANTSTTKDLDYDRVNLTLADSRGRPTQLLSVATSDACGEAPGLGWYYDVPRGEGTPTKVELCPDVCRRYRRTVGATLSFQVGCRTIAR